MTTRRDVLRAAAAGLAATWIGRPSWAAARRADEAVKLGVASYSLRKLDRRKAIEAVKACGTRYVNLKSMHLPYELAPEALKAARKEFDDAGLEVVGSGNNSLRTPAEVAQLFRYATVAKLPLLVIAPTPALLPKIEEAVKETGIPVAIHNHGPEDKVFPAPSDALKLIKDLDPRVGLCVDVGHTTRTGKDVVKEIADGGARVLDLHMKDLKNLMDKNSQCAVGEGAMPVAEIFRQLVRMGFKGYANLEYEIDADDPVPGMKKSFESMRRTLAGLEAR
jgi:sugar phosphate isomerase/epimerase